MQRKRTWVVLGVMVGMVLGGAFAQGQIEQNQSNNDAALQAELNHVVDSFPILQPMDAESVAVTWAISRPATGWVEWGPTPELGAVARNATGGHYPFEDRFLAADMTGLKPGEVYYYRTATVGLDFPRYGKITAGETIFSDVYSFTAPTADSSNANFFVMNDTHAVPDYLESLTAKILQINPDVTIWNGDLSRDVNSLDDIVTGIMRAGNIPFAAENPILFVAGNHDHRGPQALAMAKVFPPRYEHDAKYFSLRHNFAVRYGPVALIGLDTGEDKPDSHPIHAGLANFEPVRRLQAEWLDEVLSRPEIASAPFIVAFCHIPLYAADRDANPGTTLEGYAAWQSECGRLWGPILNKHRVQALITAHRHSLRQADLPETNRSWLQMHGGGPEPSKRSLIRGSVEEGKLILRRELLAEERVDEELILDPR